MEKNKLVAEMKIAKKGGAVSTIVSIVKKYCPTMEIDADFLNRFAEVLSGLHGDIFADERDFDRASDLFPPNFDEQDRLRDSMAATMEKIKTNAGSPEIIDAMAKAKYALSVIVYKAFETSEKESYTKAQMDSFVATVSGNENGDSDNEVYHEEAMSYPDYRKLVEANNGAVADGTRLDKDRTLLGTAIRMYETDSALYHNSYDYRERYEYWPEYEKGVETRIKQIDELEQSKEKGGKK